MTIQNIFRYGNFPPGMNDAFMVLISKSNQFSSLSHIRPIALCNTLYQIFTKIIVKRLPPLLFHLVSPNQAAFVPGRWIGENFIISQEIVHSMKKKKGVKGNVGIKIDLHKAYDCVDWHCLLRILDAFGFNEKFNLLIFRCLSLVNLRMLLNGSCFGNIPMEMGIRQGDPVSPFLFVLFLELLSRMLTKMEDDGEIQGLKLLELLLP